MTVEEVSVLEMIVTVISFREEVSGKGVYHSQPGLGVGVGLDLMDHKSHLSLGCASTYGWEVQCYHV